MYLGMHWYLTLTLLKQRQCGSLAPHLFLKVLGAIVEVAKVHLGVHRLPELRHPR